MIDITPHTSKAWLFIVHSTQYSGNWVQNWANYLRNSGVVETREFLNEDLHSRDNGILPTPGYWNDGYGKTQKGEIPPGKHMSYQGAFVVLSEKPTKQQINDLKELTKEFFKNYKWLHSQPTPEYLWCEVAKAKVIFSD